MKIFAFLCLGICLMYSCNSEREEYESVYETLKAANERIADKNFYFFSERYQGERTVGNCIEEGEILHAYGQPSKMILKLLDSLTFDIETLSEEEFKSKLDKIIAMGKNLNSELNSICNDKTGDAIKLHKIPELDPELEKSQKALMYIEQVKMIIYLNIDMLYEYTVESMEAHSICDNWLIPVVKSQQYCYSTSDTARYEILLALFGTELRPSFGLDSSDSSISYKRSNDLVKIKILPKKVGTYNYKGAFHVQNPVTGESRDFPFQFTHIVKD